jgi:SAM-dependent methyltransferase
MTYPIPEKGKEPKEDNEMFNAVRKFPQGTSLEDELAGAMKRVRALGVRYPRGYLDKLVRKYEKKGVNYPRILMRLGDPNIRKHEHYKEILKKKGKLLDFGCGTGDDLRQLLRDGYPKKNIQGFDIDWNSIELGFDLYMDRSGMKGIFIVAKEPRFKDEAFDIIYSGSVLHTMKKMSVVNLYLDKTHDLLKVGGILFGSTLGSFRPMNQEKRTTFLTKKSFHSLLRKKGFKNVEILRINETQQSVGKRRYWFYTVKE